MCSRILQQSDKFIFFGILVLVLHPAPDYIVTTPVECGPTSYHLGLQRRKQFTRLKSQDSNRIGHKVGPRLLVIGCNVYVNYRSKCTCHVAKPRHVDDNMDWVSLKCLGLGYVSRIDCGSVYSRVRAM